MHSGRILPITGTPLDQSRYTNAYPLSYGLISTKSTSVIGLSFFFPLTAGMSPFMNISTDFFSAACSFALCRDWKLSANLPMYMGEAYTNKQANTEQHGTGVTRLVYQFHASQKKILSEQTGWCWVKTQSGTAVPSLGHPLRLLCIQHVCKI